MALAGYVDVVGPCNRAVPRQDLAADRQPLNIAPGQLEVLMRIPLNHHGEPRARFAARVEDAGRREVLRLPVRECVRVNDFGHYTPAALTEAYHLVAEGDRKVASRQSLSLAAPPTEPAAGWQ